MTPLQAPVQISTQGLSKRTEQSVFNFPPRKTVQSCHHAVHPAPPCRTQPNHILRTKLVFYRSTQRVFRLNKQRPSLVRRPSRYCKRHDRASGYRESFGLQQQSNDRIRNGRKSAFSTHGELRSWQLVSHTTSYGTGSREREGYRRAQPMRAPLEAFHQSCRVEGHIVNRRTFPRSSAIEEGKVIKVLFRGLVQRLEVHHPRAPTPYLKVFDCFLE